MMKTCAYLTRDDNAKLSFRDREWHMTVCEPNLSIIDRENGMSDVEGEGQVFRTMVTLPSRNFWTMLSQ